MSIDGDPSLPSTVDTINVQIYIPEFNLQKCLIVTTDETIWDIKQKVTAFLPPETGELFNYGLFLPSCNGRAGKFLLDERPIGDYPFHDCVPYLELKYKKRVYKMLQLDERQLKSLQSKGNMKKFMEYVLARNAPKVEKMLAQGIDPNFHDGKGETPLTITSTMTSNHTILMSLVAGGAHLDYRNGDGQTPLHKAVFCASHENVKILLELGASPNAKDPLGLTPLYYSMLDEATNADAAELLLGDFADIGTVDMHGNQEVHQACKNGLTRQLEHLLYYGAEINATNINGNTALHVCAVNNREACARVLLFRGADGSIVNNAGQQAYHVAVIVGHPLVADVVRNFDPASAVPYRDMPRYNSKRRVNSTRATPSMHGTLMRRRSTSQSSISSARSRRSHYAQRPSLDMPTSHVPGDDANIPRILVIPRAAKGFGFILRGAKTVQPGARFEPTSAIPALQFFEGVDMNGMSMRAGLLPGDFLLEIDGVDVRRANHDQVVLLIQSARETISLKVITVVASTPTTSMPTSNGTAHYGTLPSRRPPPQQGRAKSVLPPAPPSRHPSTSLSVGKARQMNTQHLARYSQDAHQEPMYGSRRGPSSMLPAKSMEALSHYRANGGLPQPASVRAPHNSRRISAAELEQLMARQNEMARASPAPSIQQKKYGSVAQMKRGRGQPPPSHYYSEQGPSTQSFDEQPIQQHEYQQQPQQQSYQQQQQNGHQQQQHHAYHQQAHAEIVPDYEFDDDDEGSVDDSRDSLPVANGHRASTVDNQSTYSSEYARGRRPTQQPPPPPPMTMHTPQPPPTTYSVQATRSAPPVPMMQPQSRAPPAPPLPSTPLVTSAPPPPPPPSVDALRSAPKSSGKGVDCRGISDNALQSVKLKKTTIARDASAPIVGARSTTPKPRQPTVGRSGGGITADALSRVALKPAQRKDSNNNGSPFLDAQRSRPHDQLKASLAQRRMAVNGESRDPSPSTSNGGDFNTDLAAALARRRNQMDTPSTTTNENGAASSNGNDARRSLSLKESVRQSVARPSKPSQSSPPAVGAPSSSSTSQFGGKKDSGYTSSRTSLEPSECGDEQAMQSTLSLVREEPEATHFPLPPPPEYLNAQLNQQATQQSVGKNRVSILSQHIEDCFGDRVPPQLPQKPPASAKPTLVRVNAKENDTFSVTSTMSSLSGCSADSSVRRANSSAPQRPPTASADSGNGGDDINSETETEQNVSKVTVNTPLPTTHNDEFVSLAVFQWRCGDLCDWLRSLAFDAYVPRVSLAGVDGEQLAAMCTNRAAMTKLGITRLAHRQTIETELRAKLTPEEMAAL